MASTAPLQIVDSAISGWQVVQVSGELDATTTPALRQRLSELSTAGPFHVVVDLSRVTFIDSSGLGALIGGLRRLRSAGGDLRLVPGPTPKVQRMLDQTGLGQLFDLYQTADDATT